MFLVGQLRHKKKEGTRGFYLVRGCLLVNNYAIVFGIVCLFMTYFYHISDSLR